MKQVIEMMTNFEYELAKQNGLSDNLDTLRAQNNEFTLFIREVSKNMPQLNDVLAKCREFCANDLNKSNKHRELIANYLNDANVKLEIVGYSSLNFF